MKSFKTDFWDAFKERFVRLLIDFVVVSFTVPFITYDTGVRCITNPCTASAARGSLIEFLSKSPGLNAYIIDYWIFIVAFVVIYIGIELVEKLITR